MRTLKIFDAMTRGMDVEGVRNIINYDMPRDVKTHVHRAGRTARAGQTGRCFTLLHKKEVRRFGEMLWNAEIDPCPTYSVPSSSIESLHSTYESALDKLKKRVESEKSKSREREMSNVEGLEDKRRQKKSTEEY